MTSLNSVHPRVLFRAAGAAACLLLPVATASADAGKIGTWMPGTFKFMGNASCVSCHSEGKKKGGSNKEGDQFDIWEKEDPHHLSFETLSDEESKKIASKLGIKDATTDDKCLSCHAVHAPSDRRGPKWSIEEGNSCESCHGPGEKYLTPHANAGWTADQRKKGNARSLMNEWGLFDTTDLALRAEMCISCHLNIDKSLLDAGHPALRFEMAGYNAYATGSDEAWRPHWENEPKTMEDAKLWAVGQAAAAAAAKAGGNADLAAMYAKGVEIAKKHFGADSAEGLAKATYTGEKCAAAAKDLAALAPGAKNKIERQVIALGVYALTAASYDARGEQTPEAIDAPYDTAVKGDEGAAYADAVKKMAELAK